MIIVSYDIKDDKVRRHFSKMLQASGAVRLQMSVYEINNTKRHIDIIKHKIETMFSYKFSMDDSVMIFNVDYNDTIKYGNAIHRDTDVVFL